MHSSNFFKAGAMAIILCAAVVTSCNKDDDKGEDPKIIAVTGVTLNKTALPLVTGSTETLTATVAPADAANKAVKWSSDKPAVATVADGLVTAVSAGTAIITVTTTDGGKTATCTVTVTTAVVSVESVTLDQTAFTLELGDSEILTATVAPENAANKAVTWDSDNDEVATVADGYVTAVGKGTANITVTTTDGGKTATCVVTVTALDVTSVALNKTALALHVTDTETLTAIITPDDATNPAVTWSSDKEAVATVVDGVVTAIAAGTATITVTSTDGGKTATCTVTVWYQYDKTGWTATASESEPSNGSQPGYVIDDQDATGWFSIYTGGGQALPNWIVIDMKEQIEIAKINTLRTEAGEWTNTKTLQYFISDTPDPNADSWVPIVEGAYAQGMAWGLDHWLRLTAETPRTGQYLKLVLPDSFNPPNVGIAEIYVYGIKD
jgi:uncharacterized protein YjdB